ncbi:MAG: pyrroline-5-carboxylate reductase [Hyphomicrobiaceae bacterium]
MTSIMSGTLLLVGAGKMGGAMLSGWLVEGLDPGQVLVQDPGPPPEMAQLIRRYAINTASSFEVLPEPPEVIILAVKPQVMDNVLPTVAHHAGLNSMVISVAAGRTVASLMKHLPEDTAIVRAMPNTPSAVGRGITGAFATSDVTREQAQTCQALLEAVGEVVWIDDESQIDAVTGVSGSGPAYIFHLVEALAAAGEKMGLAPDVAMKLARTTVTGAGELLHQSDLDAATLRQNVTSPGGTTAAALEILMNEEYGFPPLLAAAVAAAKKRSEELSG